MKRFNLTIEVSGPFMATGVEAAAHGVDAPFLRDHKGEFVVPGTQIRGLARHVLLTMAEAGGRLDTAAVERLFGRASAVAPDTAEGSFEAASSAWAPDFGEIEFADLHINRSERPSGTMTRIAVDGFTGAISHGSLQVLEQPIGVAERVALTGHFYLRCRDGNEEEMARWVEKALSLVPAIGAHKSAGFGRVNNVSVSTEVISEIGRALDEASISAAVKVGAVDVAINFDEPFLVSSGRWNTNIYSGSPDVPGSVLKAVLGRDLGAAHESSPLHACLAGCVVSELRPAKADEFRPRTRPLSLYFVDDGTGNGWIEDAILSPPEVWAEDGELISFAPDWKDDSAASIQSRENYPRSFMRVHDVRTHTAINDKGTADTGKLFTFAAIDPSGHVWKGRISRGALNDSEFTELLRALPDRLFAIGKTRVSASLSAKPAVIVTDKLRAGEVVLVLETDACLHTPETLFDFPDAPSAERLRLQYQSYFAAALRERGGDSAPSFADADLSLTFYASQRRVGGYVSARYAPTDAGYYPWLLTQAGSTFRLTIPSGLETAAQSFVDRGLPPPAGFDAQRKHWRGNPYVPENGYGEVRASMIG